MSSPLLIVGCSGDNASVAAVAAPTGENEDEVVRAIKLDELAASNALRGKVEEQNTTWGDENIMNGSVSVIARKVAPSAISRLDRVAKAAFNDRIKNEEVTLKGAVTTSAGNAGSAKEAAKRIAVEGFVYSNNRDNIGPVEDAVKALVTALGPAGDIEIAIAEGNVKVESSGDDDPWRASVFVFANKKSNELVIFYARAGWI